MAVIDNNRTLTLMDYLKRCNGKGEFDSQLVDFVAKSNPILKDVSFVSANNGTTLDAKLAKGIHRPTWVGFGDGLMGAKTDTADVKYVAGRMGTMIEVEGDAYDNANEEGKTQLIGEQLEKAAEGMNQEMARTLVYGSVDNEPRSFNGLYTIYNEAGGHLVGIPESDVRHFVINGAKAQNPSTAALRSIVAVKWHPNGITGFYPQNAKSVGMSRGKFEPVRYQTPDGKWHKKYLQDIYWMAGLAMMDFRNGGRIANIEADAMVTADGHVAQGQPNYIQLIQRLTSRLGKAQGRLCLYMSEIVWENLMTIFGNMTQANAITFENVDQFRKVPHLYGIPVSICDCLEVDEELVPVTNA